MKLGCMVLAFMMLIPLAYPITIKELVAKYDFSALTTQMSVTGYTDFMIDKNENEINDTLVFELTTLNTAGTFVFVINLFDRNGVLANETNKTLAAGINKANITFSSLLLSQEQFNYTIKVYNSTRKQKFRKDNILTQIYSNYEEGFRIPDIHDTIIDKKLRINVTVNSPKDETHITTLFLGYANQSIFSKGSKTFKQGTNNIVFDFDSEAIKRTHYTGNFSISSVKIGRKTYKTDFATSFYDFRDFASSSYVSGFADEGVDIDGNGKFDFLKINADISAFSAGSFILAAALHDLFGVLVETKNLSVNLDTGNNAIPLQFSGANINEKKINGPFVIKSIELYENGVLTDKLTAAYTTKSYNFNDFENPDLPDLAVNIVESDGTENLTINITLSNIGKKHAFNANIDIFGNNSFSKSTKAAILDRDSKITYQLNFANASDFEINAVADLQNLVEESDESNNAQRIIIRLGNKPVLDKDSDNDGIEDDIDKIIGNENSVNTSTLSLKVFIDNSNNLSKPFNKTARVRFRDSNLTIAEFDFDFFLHRLNLANISINRQSGNAKGSLLVSGLKIPEGTTKTLYMDKINATINGICIKDEEIILISEISGDCSLSNEFKVECDGTSQNSYTCTYNSTSNKYKIQGLKHSGIVQLDYAKPSLESGSSSSSSASGGSSGGSSGSGGGGSLICISDWQCDEWSACIDGFRKRECIDANQCAFPANKPAELQQCSADEKKLVNIIKPLGYIGKTIKKIKENIQPEGISPITGQTVKSSRTASLGIFIAFTGVLLIVGCYLAIKKIFLKNV
ncbi:hypothetical protein HYX05_00515 [Candidatus Woesearchaeota archaeon]|nr:hypothetical protein [Candidatus Woesearchaeota archaeon]